jgi:hypothetical protein
MANVLTGLITDLYAGLNVVSREMIGYIPAVSRNASAERAAVGQAVKYHIAPAANGVNITPAMTIPEPTDQTVGNDSITITKARAYEFGFVGEEQLSLDNGPGHVSVQANMFAEALRALTNEIENDLADAAYVASSRATGTAGTTPFASGVGDSAQARKILDDNGAPMTDRQLVINTSAGANLRTNTQLTKANEANDATMLRQGVLLDMHGFAISETGQGASHTIGTGSGYLLNDASSSVDDTVIAADTGTGTVVAGDVVTFAGDTNKYVVETALSGGSFGIAKPGLLVALADNAAITVGNAYDANVAFARSAMHLAIRPPALPEEGDLALDRLMMADPRSGMVFEVSVYGGYRKVRYEVAAAWGWKAINPAHMALLLG